MPHKHKKPMSAAQSVNETDKAGFDVAPEELLKDAAKAGKTHLEGLDYVADSRTLSTYHTPPLAFITTCIFILLIIIFFVWAASTELDTITVAKGKIVSGTHLQVLQNLEGGIVEKILVKEGQKVKRGQLLVVLDDTAYASSFRANATKRVALQVRIARLLAEAFGKKTLVLPKSIQQQYPTIYRNEMDLFTIDQKRLSEVLGVLKKRQSLVTHEFKVVSNLVTEGVMAPLEKLRLQQKLSEIQGAILDKTNEFRGEARQQLVKAHADFKILRESVKATQDRITRTKIVAPLAGIVNNLHVHTIGQVVQPGKAILEISPSGQALSISARVPPNKIAFLHEGLRAMIKIDAYDYSIYGGLTGKIIRISADAVQNQTGETYYEVDLVADHNYLDFKGNHLKIIPGMTVTANVITDQKSVLSYLLKPFIKTLSSGLRER